MAKCQRCRDLFQLALATENAEAARHEPAMVAEHPAVPELLSLLAGTASQAERELTFRHLATCDDCRSQLAAWGRSAHELVAGAEVQADPACLRRARHLWQQAVTALPARHPRLAWNNPMTIGILADDSRSMAGDLAREVTDSIRDLVTMLQAAGGGERSLFRLLLVKFGDFPAVLYDRTPVLDVDPSRIEFTGSSGGTDIASALEVVHETLAHEPHTDNSLAPLVVLFSDGAPTGADPAPWAERIKSLPYPADQQPLLVTCGFGQADRSLLRKMATSAEHYKDVPSAFALKEFLAAIGSTLTAAGGTEPNLNRQMRDLIRGT